MERIIALPQTQCTCDVSDGTGVPVVFLHAFPMNRNMWRPQLAALGAKYRMAAPDLRGHGATTQRTSSWTISHLADDVVELMDALEMPQAVLCGLSLGGYVALEFAAKYPQRLKGLILADTKAAADGNEAKEKRYQTMRKIEQGGHEAFAIEFSTNGSALPAAQGLLAGMIRKNKPAEILNGFCALAARKDHLGILAQIQVPTLVLVGEQDKITPPSDAQTIKAGIKGSSLQILAGAGHISNMDAAEAFTTALEDFLHKF